MKSRRNGTRKVDPLWARMREPSLESAFRDFDFRATKRRMLAFVTIAATGMFVFSSMEFSYREWDGAFARVQATRFFVAGALVVFGAVLKRVRQRVLFEKFAFTVAIAISLIACTAPLHRPPDYLDNFIFDVLLILSYYLLFPLPLRLHVIPPLLVTAMQLIVLFTVKEVEGIHQIAVVTTSLLVANIVGIYASRQMNKVNRLRYLDFLRERELKHELQETLDRLDLLEGIIPICAHCKCIRNDVGDWEQVEAYVRSRSNVEFSHSVCPECARKHFKATSKG
jgi:hypothetical protein